MTLKGFLSGAKKTFDSSVFFAVSVMASVAGSAYLSGDLLIEEWDGQVTEKTEIIAQNFRENIEDLKLLEAKINVSNGEKKYSERSEGSWLKGSEKWERYTLNNIRSLEQLDTGKSEFLHKMFTNRELPEETISDLVGEFKMANLNDYRIKLPDQDEFYALREMQKENEGKSSYTIMREMQHEVNRDEINTVFFVVIGFLFGLSLPISLVKGVDLSEEKLEKYERKKANAPQN